LQEFLTRRHPDFKYFSFRRFQRFVADSAAGELFEQPGQVVRDEVNDIQFERLLSRDDGALGDRRPGPLGVAMTLVCDGFDEAGGIVLHFLLHHVIGFFRVATHADGHRMRSANSRVRRHRGYVGGHRDKRARAARARSGRGNVNDRRHGRSVEFPDDVPGRIEQAAGRVELDDEADVLARGSDVNRPGNVAGGGGANRAVDFNQSNPRRAQVSPGDPQ
jgi:hypothetical protein